jgi:hypothetical protein
MRECSSPVGGSQKSQNVRNSEGNDMNAGIRVRLITLAILASIFQINAAAVVPIAINPGLVEISGGIAYDGNNCHVVRAAGTNVVGQLVSSKGALLSSQIIAASNPGFPPLVGVVFGQTNYFLAWSDDSVSSGVDIFGQFVSRTGTFPGSEPALVTDPGSQVFPSLAFHGSACRNQLARERTLQLHRHECRQ